MNYIKTWYSNLRFKSKIFFMTSALFSTLALALFFIFFISSIAEYKQECHIIAEENAETTIRAFNSELSTISKNLTKLMITEQFQKGMNDVLSGESTPKEMEAYLQRDLKSIKSSSELIKTIYLLDKYGNIYALYEDFKSTQNRFTDFSSLSSISQKQIFPVTTGPFIDNKEVIPMVIPLNRFSSSNIVISGTAPPELLLIILLDSESIQHWTTMHASAFLKSTSYLLYRGESLYPDKEIPYSKYFEIEEPTSIRDLTVLFRIDENSYPAVGVVFMVCLISGMLATILIAIFLTARLSRKMTEPLEKMNRAVYQIADRTYDYNLTPRYNDETGTLMRSLNQMYQTLEKQFKKIQTEEALKYRYKSQMLTLEIHPHFIYNTLEMINMEVIAGNADAASDMIQNFAAFLRYTLNQRDDWSTVAREYEFVRSYIKLMNKRRDGFINFSTGIESGLEEFEVPKSILIPLVENSIKHGFPQDGTTSVIMPEISIRTFRENDSVHIVVSDNGTGIDIEKAERIINDRESQKGYIGIGNVYRRIKIYYKEASMRFSSIPFFENNVELILKERIPDPPEYLE